MHSQVVTNLQDVHYNYVHDDDNDDDQLQLDNGNVLASDEMHRVEINMDDIGDDVQLGR